MDDAFFNFATEDCDSWIKAVQIVKDKNLDNVSFEKILLTKGDVERTEQVVYGIRGILSGNRKFIDHPILSKYHRWCRRYPFRISSSRL